MAEEKKETWLNYLALTTVIFAVCATLSTIAALLKKKIVWMLGLFLGVVGLVYFMNGFFLFI